MRIRSKCVCMLGCAVLLAPVQSAYSQTTPSLGEPPPKAWRKLNDARPAQQSPSPGDGGVPSQLYLPPGTWIRIRVDQPLSSDRNQPGDQFTATLIQPLVVDGIVVARRGQTVGGQVTFVQKAGRIKGTSRMALELTELTLADGRQVPIRSQLIEFVGGTSLGRDATAVAATTGMGAAIGAIADGGFGAGMGAIAGAAASTVGVLVTRGRPTEIYPESVLTFRTVEPLGISTRGGEGAFLPVQPQDYEQSMRRREARAAPNYYPRPYVTYYPYSWAGPWGYAPFWYGPPVFFYSGPRYYGWYGPGYHGWHH